MYELKHIYGDLFYQVFRRFQRIADPFHTYVVPTALVGLYAISGQHMAFMVNLFFNKIKRILSFSYHLLLLLVHLAKLKSLD